MTTTAPDVDALQLLDLDWHHETPCTATVCAQGRPPAAWRLVWSCGCVSLICDPCKVTVDHALALDDGRPHVARCQKCGLIQTSTLSDLLVALEPIS